MGRPRSPALNAAITDVKNGMSINDAVKKHGAPVASIYRLVHAGEIIPHKNEKERDRNPQTGKGYELDKFLQRILCMRWKRI